MNDILIEIHDVTPYYEREFYRAVKFLKELEISKFSLLVIPNFWDREDLLRAEKFIAFVKSLQQEIILHGYTHLGKPRIRYIFSTNFEGEFLYLSLEDTVNKIEYAIRSFEVLNLPTNFFVPPAWLGNIYLEGVLKSFNFCGIAYKSILKNLLTEKVIYSPALTFSNRNIFSYLSLKLNPLYFKIIEKEPLIRFAIHTLDFRDERKIKIWRSLVEKIKFKRRFVNYGDIYRQS